MARIVVVEDEIQVLMLAESVLQQAGHGTVCPSTVAEAPAPINSKDEKFDLVFGDVELGNHKEGGLTIGKLGGEALCRFCTQADALSLTGCKRCLSSVARSCPSRTALSS
jgi:hypothetical protein